MPSPPSRFFNSLEPLESRIAPAAVFAYTEADGDHVTIKTSIGTTADLTSAATVVGGQLQTLDLSNAAWSGEFAGATVTISVKKGPAGDGEAAVGYLNATGTDLGTVTIKGDLGRIDAGDAITISPAIKALTVASIGRYGVDTQWPGGTLASNINGALNKLTVAGDITAALIKITGGADGKLGSVTLAGSLVGGGDIDTGVRNLYSRRYRCGEDRGWRPGRKRASFRRRFFARKDRKRDAGWIPRGRVEPRHGRDPGRRWHRAGQNRWKYCGRLRAGMAARLFSGSNAGGIAGLSVAGSVLGGSNTDTGGILAHNQIGPVKIGVDLAGGSSSESGVLRSGFAGISSVTIGGSMRGGTAGDSGEVAALGDLGPVKIGGDLVGGPAASTAVIQTHGAISSVAIRGSLKGDATHGTGAGRLGSGAIVADKDIGKVKIGGDFVGGSIEGTDPDAEGAGWITSLGRIGSVTIGGSILAGRDDSTAGSLTFNASITAGNDIGSLKVGGDVIGTYGPNGFTGILISARGQAVPAGKQDLAMGNITVGGRVEFTQFLAGYLYTLDQIAGPANGDASIGSVKIGGAWIGSNLIAGADPGGDVQFANSDDGVIAGGNPGRTATIASITIGGLIAGTPNALSSSDHYGFFVAQQIGSFKATGFKALLTAGTNAPIELSTPTGDVTVREV